MPSNKDERLQAEKFLEFIFDQVRQFWALSLEDSMDTLFWSKRMQVKSQREDEQARYDDLESQMTIVIMSAT